MDRLTHGVLELEGGHRMGVSWAGRGIPIVLLHGFGAEARVYAQSASRLTRLGLRVIGIDAPGHGESSRPAEGSELADWADHVDEALTHLGVRHALLLGHSMGGRLAAEVAARRPDRALGVVLVDAILGGPWDRRLRRAFRFPPALSTFGAAFFVDTAQTAPPHRDREQAWKLWRLAQPMVRRRLANPLHALEAARAVLRAEPSVELLERLRAEDVPVTVLHGERDLIVPLDAGRDAAARTDADLVIVRGARHSWPLSCPETLPVIVEELLGGRLGDLVLSAARRAGIRREQPTIAELEDALYHDGAPALSLPTVRRLKPPEARVPRFDWRIERPSACAPRPAALAR